MGEDERKVALLVKLLEGSISESENHNLGNLLGVALARLGAKPGEGLKV